MRIAALYGLLALVAACAATEEITQGPYYTDGFTDGCRTAEARRAAFDSRSFRNEELFAAQESYRAGWRAGFAECQPPGVTGVNPTDAGRARDLP